MQSKNDIISHAFPGALPDKLSLANWREQSVDAWISVCGVDLNSIYNQKQLFGLEGRTFNLADPFSKDERWQAGNEHQPSSLFAASSDFSLRNTLQRAVQCGLDYLRQDKKVAVFCHLGQSRSPLVCAAMLGIHYQLPPLEIWRLIENNYSVLPIGVLGYAALNWLYEIPANSN